MSPPRSLRSAVLSRTPPPARAALRRARAAVRQAAASPAPRAAAPAAAPPAPAPAPAEEIGAEWRAGHGGTDLELPERAFPGMPDGGTMAAHAIRYAFAMHRVSGRDVLDLGCGTAYGSEMLSWTAGRVRGFDLWEPAPEERPRWPGVTELHYGHDLTADPLPAADVAVMFEVLEHLDEAEHALRLAWQAVDELILSFPNPVAHGSHRNPHHVNDWTLERVEAEISAAAGGPVSFYHVEQDALTLRPGREPDGDFWLLIATRLDAPPR